MFWSFDGSPEKPDGQGTTMKDRRDEAKKVDIHDPIDETTALGENRMKMMSKPEMGMKRG